jgi:uncharacterized protein (TIGR02594 family)
VGLLPRTISEGLALFGVQEIMGRGSNRTILGWRDELNQNGVSIRGFSDDDIAWCGLFAAIVAFRRMSRADEVVKDPLWARNWLGFGVKSPTPGLGDVLVFSRGEGGHVGFYVAEDSLCYHVLGGNQSNAVTIARIPRSRLLGARRPLYKVTPASAKPFIASSSGAISTNEQ